MRSDLSAGAMPTQAVKDPAILEFILQNGGPAVVGDGYGRTPLHYAILLDHAQVVREGWGRFAEAPQNFSSCSQAAKALLRRGASAAARDQFGTTPFDAAVAKGRVRDEELFLLLSSG